MVNPTRKRSNRRALRGTCGVRRERGTSVVEMAFVLPLLLFIVFAIGDFGLAYLQWNSLTNAAREGAREGIISRTPCNAGAVDALVDTRVATAASQAGIGATVTTNVVGACTGRGNPLTVTATVPYDYLAMSALAGAPDHTHGA